jgi:hypothetical protein
VLKNIPPPQKSCCFSALVRECLLRSIKVPDFRSYWPTCLIRSSRRDCAENDAYNNSSIVACVFVAAETILPTRCLAKIVGNTQTETSSSDL